MRDHVPADHGRCPMAGHRCERLSAAPLKVQPARKLVRQKFPPSAPVFFRIAGWPEGCVAPRLSGHCRTALERYFQNGSSSQSKTAEPTENASFPSPSDYIRMRREQQDIVLLINGDERFSGTFLELKSEWRGFSARGSRSRSDVHGRCGEAAGRKRLCRTYAPASALRVQTHIIRVSALLLPRIRVHHRGMAPFAYQKGERRQDACACVRLVRETSAIDNSGLDDEAFSAPSLRFAGCAPLSHGRFALLPPANARCRLPAQNAAG
jgi:hypothetical protein